MSIALLKLNTLFHCKTTFELCHYTKTSTVRHLLHSTKTGQIKVSEAKVCTSSHVLPAGGRLVHVH